MRQHKENGNKLARPLPLSYKLIFMKYFLIIIVMIAAHADAQTTGGTNTTQRKTQAGKQEKKRVQRGTGQYYGNKDTTPGSPMGTGGAGGDMSGSPAGSAIETDDQTTKPEANKDSAETMQDTTAADNTTTKKPSIKKTKSAYRKTKRL